MYSVEIKPAALNGCVDIPPSKSLGHRAIISAALARGKSCISNIVLSEDISATIDAMNALGAEMTFVEDKAYVNGIDFSSTANPTIDCRESGSTLRFIIPIGLLTDKSINYIGSGNLKQRPLDPYIEVFNKQGIEFSSSKLPINIKGKLKPGVFQLRGDISSQFITGLMFALPILPDDSSIYIVNSLESKAYIDLTIDVLESFGIKIQNMDYKSFYIKGRQSYKPTEYSIEGDYSQAAFWIAAGVLGNHVKCTNLYPYSRQGDKVFIDILRASGAHISTEGNSITACKSSLKAFNIDVSQFPDIAPILAVVAALSNGTSHITGASRLRFKESDRLKAISTELNKLGAEIFEGKDNLTINGKETLNGGSVDSWNDHRIAMALSIASIRCSAPVIINNSKAVSKSYPGFFADFAKLGGIINERSLG